MNYYFFMKYLPLSCYEAKFGEFWLLIFLSKVFIEKILNIVFLCGVVSQVLQSNFYTVQ